MDADTQRLLEIYGEFFQSIQPKLNQMDYRCIDTLIQFNIIDIIKWLVKTKNLLVYLDAGNFHYDTLCVELKRNGLTIIETKLDIEENGYVLDESDVRQHLFILREKHGMSKWYDSIIPVDANIVTRFPIEKESLSYGVIIS